MNVWGVSILHRLLYWIIFRINITWTCVSDSCTTTFNATKIQYNWYGVLNISLLMPRPMNYKIIYFLNLCFQGCARFVKIFQKCVPCQVFRRMWSIVFVTYPLRLSIQILLFVALTRSVFLEPHKISAKHAQPRMLLKSDSVVLRSISRSRTYSKPVGSALQSSYAGYSVWDKS